MVVESKMRKEINAFINASYGTAIGLLTISFIMFIMLLFYELLKLIGFNFPIDSNSLFLVITILATFGMALYIYNIRKSERDENIYPDEVIEEVVELVMKGEEPMKGIMMLKDLIENEPKNVKAHLVLGMFSIQSGQFEKAIDRFEKVLAIDPNSAEA